MQHIESVSIKIYSPGVTPLSPTTANASAQSELRQRFERSAFG
ncbi:hypothetical protein ACVY1S_003572 [Salmonella enterica subsp. enterica]